jgi:hypothetical protein
VSGGRAHLAANILVETWQAMGSPPESYDLVWEAKEWLHNAGGQLDAAAGSRVSDG